MVDFDSRRGIYEYAKKKGKKATSVPLNLAPEKKEDDVPPGDGNNNNGDKKGGTGNSGAGGGAGGGGNGNNGNSGGGGGDDEWATFTSTKPKKKKGEADGGLPTIPTSDFGTDAFQEIKLGEDIGGKLDVNFGAPGSKNGAGSWGTGGGGGWDWSGAPGADPGGGGAGGGGNAEGNPWSIDRPKPKKTNKSTFSFGADEPDDSGGKPDDDWGFVSTKDKKKQSNLWGQEEDNKEAWAFGASDKKGSAALLDGTLDDPTPGKKEDDIWDTWGGGDPKAKKKNLLGDFGPPDPAPETAAGSSAIDSFWGAVTGKKDTKKKIPEAPDPPASMGLDDDFGWGFGSKKKPEPKPVEDEGEFWSFAKKITKKTNALFADEEPAPVKQEPAADDSWGFWGAKKREKKPALFDDPVPEAPPKKNALDDLIQLDDGVGGGGDDFFSSFGVAKKNQGKAINFLMNG